jgi:hypothetical protein
MILEFSTPVKRARLVFLCFLLKPINPNFMSTADVEGWVIDEISQCMSGGMKLFIFNSDKKKRRKRFRDFKICFMMPRWLPSDPNVHGLPIVREKYFLHMDLDDVILKENSQFGDVMKWTIGMMEEYVTFRQLYLNEEIADIFTSGVTNDLQRLQH